MFAICIKINKIGVTKQRKLLFVNLRASILVCNPSVLYKLNSLGPDCCIECAIASCSHADPRVFILLLSDWSKMSPASLSLASTPQTEQISKKNSKKQRCNVQQNHVGGFWMSVTLIVIIKL